MLFAAQLQDSLNLRRAQVPHEFANGGKLSDVLAADLRTVEAAADTEMLTSILLLDGNRLRHGAAPSLPQTYCEAIDGGEIGPAAGSCGTAAFLGRSVYVTDIASDPLWADYCDIALAHGLRACWSTPIFDDGGSVIATFAIYHPSPRSPTPDEVESIKTITDHVACAIMSARRATAPGIAHPVADNDAGIEPASLVSGRVEELLHIAGDFEKISGIVNIALEALVADAGDQARVDALRRAGIASRKGAALARKAAGLGDA
jgi:hypothetical protein